MVNFGRMLKRITGGIGRTVTVMERTDTNTDSDESNYYDRISNWTNTNVTAIAINTVKGRDAFMVDEGFTVKDYLNVVLPHDTSIGENDVIKIGSDYFEVRRVHTSHVWGENLAVEVLVRRKN